MWFDTCDIRDAGAVQRVVDGLIAHYGQLDVVVNNAAGNFPAPITSISPNGFKAVVDIDLLGTYNVSKATFDAWLHEHGGNIVNITAPFEMKGAAHAGARGRGQGGRRLVHPHRGGRVGSVRHPGQRRRARATSTTPRV